MTLGVEAAFFGSWDDAVLNTCGAIATKIGELLGRDIPFSTYEASFGRCVSPRGVGVTFCLAVVVSLARRSGLCRAVVGPPHVGVAFSRRNRRFELLAPAIAEDAAPCTRGRSAPLASRRASPPAPRPRAVSAAAVRYAPGIEYNNTTPAAARYTNGVDTVMTGKNGAPHEIGRFVAWQNMTRVHVCLGGSDFMVSHPPPLTDPPTPPTCPHFLREHSNDAAAAATRGWTRAWDDEEFAREAAAGGLGGGWKGSEGDVRARDGRGRRARGTVTP